MSTILQILNTVMTTLFGWLLLPFRGLSPIWALLVVSSLTGVLMLWIFGKVSDQATIGVLRDRVRGHLLGIRLFGDDLRTLFRLQWRLLRDNAIYLRYALLPMLIMLLPVLLVMTQLNLFFDKQPLAVGQTAIVKVKVRDAQTLADGVTLDVPAGVVVETPPVRSAAILEVAWRIRADETGAHRMRILADGDPVEKELRVGGGWGATSALRSAGLLDLLLYPGEAPILAASGITAIEVTYDALPLSVFGFEIHWLIVFFVVSLAAGFALKGPLGVEI